MADSYNEPDDYPAKQNEYKNVTVGKVTYDKTFRENDVLRIRLNHCNIAGVLNAMYQSYYRLYETAVRAYTWENGQHWKVKVDQMTQGDGDFAKNFSEMIKEQMKPFFGKQRRDSTRISKVTNIRELKIPPKKTILATYEH